MNCKWYCVVSEDKSVLDFCLSGKLSNIGGSLVFVWNDI